MNNLEETNENRSFMKGSYTDTRLDKSVELNDTMTINEESRDEYESTIMSLGGTQSNG